MSDTDNKPTKTVSADFVHAVKKFVDVDNKLKDLKDRVKQLTTEKKDKEEFILEYLKSVNEEEVGIEDGKLKRTISKNPAPFKKESIEKALIEITGDSIQAQKLTDHIIKSRNVIERTNLKRIKNKIK